MALDIQSLNLKPILPQDISVNGVDTHQSHTESTLDIGKVNGAHDFDNINAGKLDEEFVAAEEDYLKANEYDDIDEITSISDFSYDINDNGEIIDRDGNVVANSVYDEAKEATLAQMGFDISELDSFVNSMDDLGVAFYELDNSNYEIKDTDGNSIGVLDLSDGVTAKITTPIDENFENNFGLLSSFDLGNSVAVEDTDIPDTQLEYEIGEDAENFDEDVNIFS